jgi:hypothetical protein
MTDDVQRHMRLAQMAELSYLGSRTPGDWSLGARMHPLHAATVGRSRPLRNALVEDLVVKAVVVESSAGVPHLATGAPTLPTLLRVRYEVAVP